MIKVDKKEMKQSLSRKLLLLILLSSSIVTLITTSLQLYIDYEADLEKLKDSIESIKKAHINALTTSVWTFDKKQIENILHGIEDSSEVIFVGISGENGSEIFSVGDKQESNFIDESTALTYNTNSSSYKVGSFYIQMSLTTAKERLINRILIVLLGQGLKTFIVSSIILFLIRLLVTQHLINIAHFLQRLDVRKGDAYLKLDRTERDDEINIVVKSINSMIKELKSALNTLQIMNERLEQKVRDRTAALNGLLVKNENLIRVICHDVSNHITIVRSGLFSLQKEKVRNDPEKFNARLEKSQKHNEIIIEILEHVKQLKSLESGKATLTLEKINLLEVVRDLQDTFMDRLIAKNIKLDLIGVEKPVYVMADKVSLRTNILNNLISNAIKFTPAGETIILKIVEEITEVCILISDKGIGIPPDLLEKLFDTNAQTTRPGTEQEKGTGFGLPIVYMFVKYNKGTITVSSETEGIDKGTTFKVTLKAAA